MQRTHVRRKLRNYVATSGNWRLKGLLLALRDDTPTRAVGEAWPVTADERRSLQRLADGPTAPVQATYSLAHRPDSIEHERALSQFDRSDERGKLLFGSGLDRDEYYSRMLINESVTELDVAWREELTETVVMGAAARKAARDAATVDPVDARKGDLPTEGTEPFAATGAEGAGAEFNETDYHQTAYDCELHEQGFALSEELIDQAEPDMIEQQIRKAGRAVENAINRQFINELIDNATNYDADLSGSGSTDTRDLLMKASEAAANNDFDPTNTLVMHPEYASELFGNNQLAGLNGVASDMVEEQDNTVVGHRVFIMSGSAYDSGSQTYGFESNSEKGALVYNREFVRLPVYRDIETTELPERVTAIRDIEGGVARAYTDTVAVDEDGDGTYESVVRVQR